MRMRNPNGRASARPQAVLLAAIAFAVPTQAQQLIGYVSTKDADVTGASDVLDGHAVLSGAVAVTAKDHAAPITLGRGGAIRVCQTSVLHLTQSRAATLAAPLLLSLDRGAVEIQMAVTSTDAVMTPDLRLAALTPGPLDLQLRVARNGDTCVENRGLQAPTLAISDTFGESRYQLLPNQHVLFEHGSLREVVDHETTPCGCPDSATGRSIADALLAPGSGAGPGVNSESSLKPANVAAAQNPFPAAVSEGLAPAAEVPQAPPGVVHAQITSSLAYSAAPAAQDASAALPPTMAAPALAGSTAPAPVEPHRGPMRAIGHFLHKLFGGD